MSPEDDIATEDKMSLAPSLALLGTSEMWSVAPVLSLQSTKDAPSFPELYLLRSLYQMCIRPVDALGVTRLIPICEKCLSLQTSKYILVNTVL